MRPGILKRALRRLFPKAFYRRPRRSCDRSFRIWDDDGGSIHRLDGLAAEHDDGTKMWYENGVLKEIELVNEPRRGRVEGTWQEGAR